MSRGDGLSFWSKPDLLQRHKTSTNKYIHLKTKRGEKGLREGSRKERSWKIIANQSFYFRSNWRLWTNRSKVVRTECLVWKDGLLGHKSGIIIMFALLFASRHVFKFTRLYFTYLTSLLETIMVHFIASVCN